MILDELLAAAREKWDSMTPAECKSMIESQRRSYVIAEAGFGSDADEVAYAKALRDGDRETLERLDGEAEVRMDHARRVLDGEVRE